MRNWIKMPFTRESMILLDVMNAMPVGPVESKDLKNRWGQKTIWLRVPGLCALRSGPEWDPTRSAEACRKHFLVLHSKYTALTTGAADMGGRDCVDLVDTNDDESGSGEEDEPRRAPKASKRDGDNKLAGLLADWPYLEKMERFVGGRDIHTINHLAGHGHGEKCIPLASTPPRTFISRNGRRRSPSPREQEAALEGGSADKARKARTAVDHMGPEATAGQGREAGGARKARKAGEVQQAASGSRAANVTPQVPTSLRGLPVGGGVNNGKKGPGAATASDGMAGLGLAMTDAFFAEAGADFEWQPGCGVNTDDDSQPQGSISNQHDEGGEAEEEAYPIGTGSGHAGGSSAEPRARPQTYGLTPRENAVATRLSWTPETAAAMKAAFFSSNCGRRPCRGRRSGPTRKPSASPRLLNPASR
mmetsp:Transcript_30296/g.75950  ORF Transcript_30296/g.75950 Transcript_30296/m.75950 type:complete len:419 (-) Transcript_30296:298-1554(-)